MLLAAMGVGYEIRSAVVDCLEMTILLVMIVANLSARCWFPCLWYTNICHLNWQSEVAMMESNCRHSTNLVQLSTLKVRLMMLSEFFADDDLIEMLARHYCRESARGQQRSDAGRRPWITDYGCRLKKIPTQKLRLSCSSKLDAPPPPFSLAHDRSNFPQHR